MPSSYFVKSDCRGTQSVKEPVRLDDNHNFVLFVDPVKGNEAASKKRLFETRVRLERVISAWGKPNESIITSDSEKRESGGTTEKTRSPIEQGPELGASNTSLRMPDPYSGRSGETLLSPRQITASNVPALNAPALVTEEGTNVASKSGAGFLTLPFSGVISRRESFNPFRRGSFFGGFAAQTRRSEVGNDPFNQLQTQQLNVDAISGPRLSGIGCDLSGGLEGGLGPSIIEVAEEDERALEAQVPICGLVAGGNSDTIHQVHATVTKNRCPILLIRVNAFVTLTNI
ncbi:unnamed protein product [Protopolystoma xenopodis]|uniref:Uncharacterized protein n=1 Tax=Protopolystoma xenopodis TaxID=117903 RepID=A0A448XEF7_9PLAT|nr:unnamed protein product [Protopolystoma xenopodis]